MTPGLTEPRRVLSLLDSTCLIVGIIVGVGLYQVAPDVARGVGGPAGLLALWVFGGLLSLCGALCYAELATAYPQPGGDYVYLTRAYGPAAGFLFGWAQLAIVRPGDIAVVAFTFSTYATALPDPLAVVGLAGSPQVHAVLAVAVLTLVNVLGVRGGKRTQNLLTLVKGLGLLFVIAMGLGRGSPEPAARMDDLPLSLALIFVLFCYGGWNEMAYVAAEVVNPGRNITRALWLGIVGVTLLYVAVNGAFLAVLGFDGMRGSAAVATDTVNAVWPGAGGTLISALICVSALGALNGLILTGARISFAVGRDHRLFRPLGAWSPRLETPAAALAVQGLVASGLIMALGSFLHAILYTAAVVYGFHLATTLALLTLRRREPARARPYRVAAYPFTPWIFAGTCGFLIYSAVVYKPWIAAGAILLLLAGLPLYGISRSIPPAPRTG
ncbi:MAG: amino acid permease [Verrucomicrobia bacterium]|jgi:amino acid transporter|nr:amino acid permease [Verrucomicrobiota bacterium]